MAQETATFTFGDGGEDVPRMRHFVMRWLEQNEVREPDRSELVLAVSEAVANAYEHACPPGRVICLACTRSGPRVSVSVIDEGEGFTHEPQNGSPDLLATGGRGLFLMEQLADHVEVTRLRPGTKVTLTKELKAS